MLGHKVYSKIIYRQCNKTVYRKVALRHGVCKAAKPYASLQQHMQVSVCESHLVVV